MSNSPSASILLSPVQSFIDKIAENSIYSKLLKKKASSFYISMLISLADPEV